MKAFVILVLLFLATEVNAGRPIIPGLSELGTDLNITWDGDVMIVNNIKIETMNLLFSTIRKYYPYAEITMDFEDDDASKRLVADIGEAAKRGDDQKVVKLILTDLDYQIKHNEMGSLKEIKNALRAALENAKNKSELKDKLEKAIIASLHRDDTGKSSAVDVYLYATSFIKSF
uniref:Secreted protein n=1 Tax=Panagrellus redivivus TaxID=6233 RepID=A0A7E5A066_PANRE